MSKPTVSPKGRDLLFFIRGSLFAECEAVMAAKNAAYTGATGDTGDPILNYQRAAQAANCSPAQYMLGRLQEKVTRMGVLLGNDREDDAAEEFVDVINMVVLIAYALEAGDA